MALAFTSARVKRLRRLVDRAAVRQRERAFVIEGPTLLGDALDAGVGVQEVYVAPGGASLGVVARAAAAGIPVVDLAPGVLERVAGTATPQPVLAVAPSVDVSLDQLAGASLVVVCVDVRDPGNLGTVLRSAEASGVGGIICCEGSVDVYNPKTVRASAGSLFHTQIVAGGEAVKVLSTVGEWGLRRLGTRPEGGVPHFRADLASPTALVLGNEAHGLPPAVAAVVDGWVSIPMAGRAESLNVGMAAAVLCFEAARQRSA
ncbi:MAG TPA: RNA methyltransferase [Acidimicrobiales bacterium]|jgi:TrmH family RNA methyltransferase|nr:RNA methyltransferase [Acidimicrobiales bacterium]